MRHVSTNILWNVAHYVVALLIGLYITPFILRGLGEDSYGVWILLGSLIAYYGVLNFGIDASVVKYTSQHLAEHDYKACRRVIRASSYFYSGIGLLVFAFSVAAALAYAYSNFIFEHSFSIPAARRQEAALLIGILGTGVAISFHARVSVGLIRALERYDILNAISIASLLTRVIAIVVLMQGSLLRLGIIFAAFNILSSIANIIAAKCLLPPDVKRSVAFHRPTFRKISVYGGKSFLISLADQFRFQTDPIVIGHFLSATSITYFDLGNKLVVYLRNIAGSISAPFFPLFSRQHGEGNLDAIRESFYLGTKAQALMAAILAGCLLGSGQQFLQLWVGDTIGAHNVLTCYKVLLILLLPVSIALFQGASINLLYGLGTHAFLARITIIEGIANLVLSIILIQYFGILGVAAGTAIPMLITQGFMQPRYACIQAGVSVRRYMLICLFIPFTFIIIVGLFQLAIFQLFETTTYLILIVVNLVTLLTVGSTLAFLYFPKAEREFFRRRIGGSRN